MDITKQIERITSEVKAHEDEIKSLRQKINTKNRTLRKLASLRDEVGELIGETAPIEKPLSEKTFEEVQYEEEIAANDDSDEDDTAA